VTVHDRECANGAVGFRQPSSQALSFAGIRVRDKRCADRADWRRVAYIDDSLVRWDRLLDAAGRSVREPHRLVIGGINQRGAAGNCHADRGDDSEQNHVAVFFANSHPVKTRKGTAGSGGYGKQMETRMHCDTLNKKDNGLGGGSRSGIAGS